MQPFIVGYANFMDTRLIDEKGRFFQSVHIKKAKDMANAAGLNLVCFNRPDGRNPALCKIIDYGKWKYQQEKIEKKEKHNSIKETKEIRFSPVIDINDIEHKVKQIRDFLSKGDDVLVTMRFKGIHHRLKDEGKRIINEIVEKCKDIGKEMHRKQDNDNISLRLTKV